MSDPQHADKQIPPKQVVISTIEARGAVISGRVITVLLTSVAMAILALGTVYLYLSSTRSSGM
jgi:hypothetical protein